METISDSNFDRQFNAPPVPPMLPKELLKEVNRRLLSETSYQKMLDFIFESLEQILPFDRVGVALLEGDSADPTLSLKWLRTRKPAAHLNLFFSAKVNGTSLLQVINENKPRIINDMKTYAISRPQSLSAQLIIKDGVQSSLAFPLWNGKKTIGIVFFSSFEKDTYSSDHLEIFSDIAEELVSIVDYVSLRKDLETYSLQSKNLNMLIHDLKSPLSAIQGFVQMAMEEPWYQNLPLEPKEVFEVVLRNSKTMFQLLSDLLEIAELDRKDRAFIAEAVILDAFCEDALSLARDLSKAKNIGIGLYIAENVPKEAKFDKKQILRALNNLFSNAVKFSNPGSTISLELKFTESNLKFSVRDSGPGIPSNEISKLFHEFGRTSVRPTSGESSTGLGLTIVKRIVERHQGMISVESEVGKGSVFSIFIPISVN